MVLMLDGYDNDVSFFSLGMEFGISGDDFLGEHRSNFIIEICWAIGADRKIFYFSDSFLP